MNATYTRGTATHKVTSTSVPAGTVLLTVTAGEHALIAASKTGAELRTVARTERVAPGAYERNSRIVVHFTDGTVSARCAPSQTWMAVTEPVAAEEEAPLLSGADRVAAAVAPRPVPVAAPLAVVTLDGQETTVEVTATPAAETKAYRIGKLLRTWVVSDRNGSYDPALVAHIDAANVCYDGTATLRLTPRWAEVLVDAASDMDAEHKAAARAARRTLYALFA